MWKNEIEGNVMVDANRSRGRKERECEGAGLAVVGAMAIKWEGWVAAAVGGGAGRLGRVGSGGRRRSGSGRLAASEPVVTPRREHLSSCL